MNHKKDTDDGIKERLQVLNRFSEDARDFYEQKSKQIRDLYSTKDVKLDDLIDAMVVALTASLSERYSIATLPPTPEIDSKGLRMEIVFVEFEAIR